MSGKNEQSGAALATFVVALADRRNIVDKLLADAGVQEINPEAWYAYEWAVQIFYRIERELGKPALTQIGRAMIESSHVPPEIDSVEALLASLGAWYQLNARGPDIGYMTCEFEDEYTAVIDNSAWGPCSFNIGIIQGACARFGITPLIEHGTDGCGDDGQGERATTCIYRVSW